MAITDISIIHHVAIVFALLWALSSFNCCHPAVYFISLIYLYQVHVRYSMRLRRKVQFEERKQANQRRVLSDSETVRWLNHVVEKIWPICMEQIASQKILLPIIPWFLEKYKPWTAKKAVIQHLYMGRTPPMFTDIRVLRQSADDDHLVLELGMKFLSADDMSAILAVKLRKRFGFGMWAKLHVTSMHIEGKVLIGVKFLHEWPFLGRLRLCFAEPPYFQMTVKPIFNHGIDVTELPGIAGWLDKLLAVAFEETLVEPNMLVVDVEKFISAPAGGWFSVYEKEPIAYARVEIVEGIDMKPSDPNGLADPYVKGQLGPYKLVDPYWQEEFKIPICTWESPNVLTLEVRDKDHFLDDTLGDCSVNITDLRGGQKHDLWLPLRNIKMGRLHLAVTVLDTNGKRENLFGELSTKKENTSLDPNGISEKGSDSTSMTDQSQKIADKFEPINIEGKQQVGVWVHHPGSDVSPTWEPRKGKSRKFDTQIYREDLSTDHLHSASGGSQCNDDSSSDENSEGKNRGPLNMVWRSLEKIGSAFHRSPRKEESTNMRDSIPTPRVNLRAVNERTMPLKIILGDSITGGLTAQEPKADDGTLNPETEGPGKENIKGMENSILENAERSAHGVKHVLFRMGSNRSKGDTSSVSNDKDLLSVLTENLQESDSSDELSVSSSKDHASVIEGIPIDREFTAVVEGIPIDSTPINGQVAESPKEQNVLESLCDSATNTKETSDVEMENNVVSSSELHGDGLVEESSDPKLRENLAANE
uniref:C2 domain-containing protein At1g53590-like n=1 Tax=Nelumbo nucifera TaxID=4432 RepID=A0A822YX99_NELNU|nr:TPA_asm: hypothetical protein HUJ06_012709 [Nelumbo nucifera]